MPVPKHKPITSSPEGSTPESSSPVVPDQEEFRQHLRRLAVSAVQVLIEQVMREELEQCIGASWGECTPTRRGYRNGSYTRDLVTPPGALRTSTSPETGPERFIRRCLSAMLAMNPRWLKPLRTCLSVVPAPRKWAK